MESKGLSILLILFYIIRIMKIGFIGQWWIGKNYANYYEENNYDIVRYSLESEYIHNKNKIRTCDIVFIAVPTPTTHDGFDISIVEEALLLLSNKAIAVIKSTILPWYTEELQKKFPNIFILHSPEFLRENHVVEDVNFPVRNVVGCPIDSQEYYKKAQFILSILPKAKHNLITDSQSAEFIKYISNVYLATKLIFFNMMYDIVAKKKLNYDQIIDSVIADERIGKSHTEIFSSSREGAVIWRWAGWHCFPKDFKAFSNYYKEQMWADSKQFKILNLLQEYNLNFSYKQ